MTICERGNSPSEVYVCVLSHVFGEISHKQVATLIDYAPADHFLSFR